MRLRAWLRTWWAWPILASSLFAIIFAITFAATVIAPGPTAIQLFVTRDVSRPATVRLILKTISLPPLGVRSQTCDGVAFQHGFPDQALYVGIGWYVDIPARPTGQSYHCIFKNALVTRTLDIPASGAPANSMSITTPVPHTTLSRTTPVSFLFATSCDAPSSTPAGALITDAAGHSALVGEYGCGSHGGHGKFAPAIGATFAAGPGTLAVYTEHMAYPVESGWSYVSIIYDTAVSVPVVWS